VKQLREKIDYITKPNSKKGLLYKPNRSINIISETRNSEIMKNLPNNDSLSIANKFAQKGNF